MERLTIVKVGGKVIDEPALLASLLEEFSRFSGRKLLVHGGGRRATSLAESLGVESRMVKGRRVTSKEMMELVTMVYGGEINSSLVARTQALGLRSIGMTGADLGIIKSSRRPPVKVVNEQGEEELIDYGYVGDIEEVDAKALSSLLEQGVTPILAPLTYDKHGALLNTNADSIASSVAVALSTYYNVSLIFAFDKRGVLRDEKDENSLIEHLTRADIEPYLASGAISGGMFPKLENALRAIEQGVREVRITNVSNLLGGTLIDALT